MVAANGHHRTLLEIGALVQRPVTSPKPLKMLARLSTSFLIGAKKTAASSAYREVLITAPLPRILWRSPFLVATSRILWSGSMAMMKRNGEMGSPCRRPFPCLMGHPAIPLRMILEDEELRRAATQSLNLLEILVVGGDQASTPTSRCRRPCGCQA